MIRRLTAPLVALAFLFAFTPTIADPGSPPSPSGWDIQLAVNAGYVAQTTEDEAGEEETEFSPSVMTGIQAFSGGYFGFSAGVAGLPDEGESTPRIAPYVALHFGTPDIQVGAGICFDSQHGGDNDLAGLLVLTAAF